MYGLQLPVGSNLIIVPHPDDEVIGFGALMQRMRNAVVLFVTDGAPQDPYFWNSYGSREAYALARRQEAVEALKIVSATPVFLPDLVPDGIADQELFRKLDAAVPALDALIDRVHPEALLTLAYEGGHPDHDAACFMATIVGHRKRLPVWESPLYHREADGSGAVQSFSERNGGELELHVEGEELCRKIRMFRAYKSQRLVLDSFRPDVEYFRPVMDYDFTRRPFPWKLNYELWEWKMTGEEVSAAFAAYLRHGRSSHVA